MKPILLLPLLLSTSLLHAETPTNPDTNSIFQFFSQSQAPNARIGSGAYLWIPPSTPKIRAVMIGIHNGLPLTILQNPAIRSVCRNHGIAQILLTPNGSEIGPVMLKDLCYDLTDPQKTAVYDHYLQALAHLSSHPELLTAPIVPLAHSAYMDFPFNAAMRNPDQCLAAIPIKAGTPDLYAFYAPGGKSKTPAPNLSLRNVPLLILDSAAQETVVSRWKSSPYPQPFEPNFIGAYRRDRNDNPGTTYQPRNELCGASWDMMSGHFDLFPRNYLFIASWLDAVAAARLPQTPGQPLKTLHLRDGFLMNPKLPPTPDLPPTYPLPAPYLDFKGDRARALWFPTPDLAQNLFQLQRNEMLRQVELFTLLNPKGEPISLAETPMAIMPDPITLLHDDGQFTLTTHHFTTPPQICTIQTRPHSDKDPQHTLSNPLFPGKTTLQTSNLPLQFDPNGAPVELLKREDFTDSRHQHETRFTLRLKLHRLAPDCGFQMFFARIYNEGNTRFTATGRTIQIAWALNCAPNSADQSLTFPPIPDAPLTAKQILLKATTSKGLPVRYFVQKGPGIIQDNYFIPTEIPANTTHPIEVTLGAYHPGFYQPNNGIKPTPTQYQSFHLLP